MVNIKYKPITVEIEVTKNFDILVLKAFEIFLLSIDLPPKF